MEKILDWRGFFAAGRQTPPMREQMIRIGGVSIFLLSQNRYMGRAHSI
jgi:hypothetical protein